MAEGEVSLWIRVRDGFTAGFQAATNGAKQMAGQIGDVARGASTALGGELKRIWGGIADNLAKVLGDVPGVRKMIDIIKEGKASIVGGAVAAAGALQQIISNISQRYGEVAKDIEQTSIKLAAKQEQLISKMRGAKTSESFTAIERDVVGEISQLEQELAGAKMERVKKGFFAGSYDKLTGVQGAENEKITQLENAIALLRRQRDFAASRASDTVGESLRQKDAEERAKEYKNAASFSEKSADAARRIEEANKSGEEKRSFLESEAERLRAAMEDLHSRMSNGTMQWTAENTAAINKMATDYADVSVKLATAKKKDAEEAEREREKTEKEAAEKVKKAERAALEKAGKERIKSAEKSADAAIAQAERIAEKQIAAAKGIADRANFRNRSETFKEKVDALVARREEAKQAAKENEKFREKEFKLREKMERGTQLKKADQQFLKDIAQQRAGQRADAAFAAKEKAIQKELDERRKKVEAAVLAIRDKVESVLQASGGPN